MPFTPCKCRPTPDQHRRRQRRASSPVCHWVGVSLPYLPPLCTTTKVGPTCDLIGHALGAPCSSTMELPSMAAKRTPSNCESGRVFRHNRHARILERAMYCQTPFQIHDCWSTVPPPPKRWQAKDLGRVTVKTPVLSTARERRVRPT